MATIFFNTANADFFVNGCIFKAPFLRTEASFRVLCVPYNSSYPTRSTSAKVYVEKNNVYCEGENIACIDFGDGKYQLVLDPLPFQGEGCGEVIYQNSFTALGQSHLVTICGGSHILSIECDTCVIKTPLPILKDIKVATLSPDDKGLFVIKGNSGRKQYILAVLFDEDYSIAISELCDNLVIEKDKIIATYRLSDMQNHIVCKEYSFTDGKYTLIAHTSRPTRRLASKLEILPTAFVETIFARDFDTARLLTLTELHPQIEAFCDFFGNFFYVAHNPSSLDNKVYLLYRTGDAYSTRVFSFEFSQGKIANVYEG